MSTDQNKNTPAKTGGAGFWQELMRRKVIRVASVYAVTGWLIIQVAASTFPSFDIPNWAFRFVTLMLLLGFPVALIIAWAFELTPDGIKATQPVESNKPEVEEPTRSTKKRNWLTYVFAAGLPTVIFGALALFFYLPSGNLKIGDVSASVKTGVAKSVAMMPLVNMSTHEENEFFAGGIHEDVLTNLSRIKNLQVKSRTSMLKYASSGMTLSEIGKELKVDYIVEGSVRRIGNHVRVTVQLIDASNENHLWANNFERELVDSFATQSEISREISNSLHLEIQPESVEKLEGMLTVSVKAYDLYMRAVSIEKIEGRTEGSVQKRREMLEQAVKEDPDFVEAWAVLNRVYDTQLDRVTRAAWYLSEGQDGEKLVAELQAKSKRALEKAMALDPNNVETLLSSVVDNIWPKTMDQMRKNKAVFDRILATYPDHAKSWYHLGWWYSKLGDMPDQEVKVAKANAIATFEKSLTLDPFNARIVRSLLDWYRLAESQEDVTRLVERLTQIIPETEKARNLIRVSLSTKQGRVRNLFLETADEDYLKELEEIGLERVRTKDYLYPISEYTSQVRLKMYTNELDKILEISLNQLSDPNSSVRESWATYFFKETRLAIYQNRGQKESARAAASDILSAHENSSSQWIDTYGNIRASLIRANVVLGNNEKALEIAEELLVDEKFQDDERFTFRIGLMSVVDVERAVELAFAEQAKYSNWAGFDLLAAHHLGHHPFLSHPKVQAYYVNEGKWINYLAERVPEYAKYKR